MGRLSSVYRLLLYFCLFTGVSAETSTTTSSTTSSGITTSSSTEGPEVPRCNEITVDRFQLRNDVNACIVDNFDRLLGSRKRLVTLDFSYADQNTLNAFLSNFTEIYGSVEMIGNKDVVSIDFGEIRTWYANREATFVIKNNPNLKNIKWNKQTKELRVLGEFTCRKKIVQIYHNPLLDMTAMPQFDNLQDKCKYLSQGLHDCIFEDINSRQIYHTPKPEIVNNCRRIRGDLKLENMTIRAGDLELYGGGCLRLINVEMRDVKLEVLPRSRTAKCNDGAKSEIRDNKHLCHTELEKIYEYFLDADKNDVTIEPDASCAQECKKQADIDAKFMICNVITGDVDISSWFTDSPLPRYKWKNLEKIQATVIISSASITEISLPAVTTIQHLKIIDNSNLTKISLSAVMAIQHLNITDNSNLEEIDLPASVAIYELTITGNKQLIPFNLGNIPKIEPRKSMIQCYVDNTMAISDTYVLKPCTTITGELILKGLRQQPEDDALKGKIIEGCVRVEETEINNVEFLKRAVFPSCKGFHIFKNNPELCPLRTLHNETVKMEGTTKIRGCGKVCKSLAEKECVIFEGSLTITDATPVADLSELVTINGNLNIIGTNFKNLSFPKLETIRSDKAPALNIRYNKELKQIWMEKIETISADDGGKPVVEIVNNYRLENRDFLPQKLKSSCSDQKTSSCYIYNDDRSGDGIPLYGWFIVAALALHLTVVVFVIVWTILKTYHVENPQQTEKISQAEMGQQSPTSMTSQGSKRSAVVAVPSAETTPATQTKASSEASPDAHKSADGKTPEKSKEMAPGTPTKASNEGTPQQPNASKSPTRNTPEKSKESAEKVAKNH